jgi:cellulose biosynthesis protein BcsQ
VVWGRRRWPHSSRRVLTQQNLTELCLTRDELETQLRLHFTVCGMFEPLNIGVEANETNEFAIHIGHAEPIDLERIILKLNRSGTYRPRFDIIAGDHRAIKYVQLGFNPTLLDSFSLTIDEARKKYDVIIFDCNPSVSFFTRAIMENTDFLLVPLRPDGFARRGVAFMQNVIEKFYQLEQRPQVNAVFNFVTPNHPPAYEAETIKGLKAGKFPGTKWLTNGYLDASVRESGNLRVKGEYIAGGINEDFAETIVDRVRAGEAENNLKELANEYARKISGQLCA